MRNSDQDTDSAWRRLIRWLSPSLLATVFAIIMIVSAIIIVSYGYMMTTPRQPELPRISHEIVRTDEGFEFRVQSNFSLEDTFVYLMIGSEESEWLFTLRDPDAVAWVNNVSGKAFLFPQGGEPIEGSVTERSDMSFTVAYPYEVPDSFFRQELVVKHPMLDIPPE